MKLRERIKKFFKKKKGSFLEELLEEKFTMSRFMQQYPVESILLQYPVESILKNYPITVGIEILETDETDEIRDKRLPPRIVAVWLAKNPHRALILMEESALDFYPFWELNAVIAHETSHIVANYLGYKNVLDNVYKEYEKKFHEKSIKKRNMLLNLLGLGFHILSESCADQMVICEGFGKELYQFRKHDLNTYLQLPGATLKPRSDAQKFFSMLGYCHISIPFNLAQLKEGKYLDKTIRKLERKQGIKHKFIRKYYDRLRDCLSVENPPTEQKVRNSIKQLLDLYEELDGIYNLSDPELEQKILYSWH